MTDDIRPRCWRICHRCLFPVEMLGAPAKTWGSSESVRETHYSPEQEWKNMFPLWRGYEKRASPEETRFMHLATLSQMKLARRKGRMHANRGAPELIIVYYSAGADVNIHTSGHFPFVHMQVRQLMESVEEAALCFFFVGNRGDVTHLSRHLEIGCNTALGPNFQVTQRMCSARQISGEECPPSLLGRLDDPRPRTFHFSVSDGGFSTW